MSPKRGALTAAILGSTVVAVDATVVNVALPHITDDLGGGLAGQQWVANAYLLTLASLILVAGSLADIFGERRGFFPGGARLRGVFPGCGPAAAGAGAPPAPGAPGGG